MSTLSNVILVVTLAVVILIAAAVLFGKNGVLAAQPVLAAGDAEQKGITISAQGETKAKPDMAKVSLGVRTNAVTAREAMTANNTAIAQVIAKLEALGVAKKDMQTGSISLYPQTEAVKGTDGGATKIVGYWASNTLNVTINDLARVGEVLDEAITAGANSVSGISFGVKEDSKLQDEALADAVKVARAKADVVAAGLGLKVTGIKSVSVDSYGSPGPVYLKYAAAEGMRDAAASVPVEAGELTFTASVRVTFEF